MNAARMSLVAGVTILVAMGLLLARIVTSPDPQSRAYEIFNDMAHSPAFKSQSPNPNFSDGMTDRLPPAGTIARGFLPLPEDSPAFAAMRNPFADSAATVAQRGETIYKRDCLPCHGADALGDGPVTRRGFPPPPSLIGEQAAQLPDGEMFRIVTRGRGNMPPLASQVDRDDRWKVILHIRSLQRAAFASASTVADSRVNRP